MLNCLGKSLTGARYGGLVPVMQLIWVLLPIVKEVKVRGIYLGLLICLGALSNLF